MGKQAFEHCGACIFGQIWERLWPHFFIICLIISSLDCGQEGQGQEGQEGFGTEFCSL